MIKHIHLHGSALIGALALTACAAEPEAVSAPTAANAAAPTALAAVAPAVPVAAAPGVAGFDPANVPVASPALGAWPYLSLIDGYVAMTPQNSSGDSAKEHLRMSCRMRWACT